MTEHDDTCQKKLIEEWVARKADNTARSYRRHAHDLIDFLARRRSSILTCNQAQVIKHLTYLLTRSRPSVLSPASLQQARRVIFALFEWLVRTSRRNTNPLWGAPSAHDVYQQVIGKCPPEPVDVLPKEVARLLTPGLDLRAITDLDQRSRVVRANLAFWAGARSHEMRAIDRADLLLNEHPPRIMLSRNGKKIPVAIPAHVGKMLRTYVAGLRPSRDSRRREQPDRSLNLLRRAPRSAIVERQSSHEPRPPSERPLRNPTLRSIRRTFVDLAILEGSQELVLAGHRRQNSVVFTPPAEIPVASIKTMFERVAGRVQRIARP